jgi:hypothetical protein
VDDAARQDVDRVHHKRGEGRVGQLPDAREAGGDRHQERPSPSRAAHVRRSRGPEFECPRAHGPHRPRSWAILLHLASPTPTAAASPNHQHRLARRVAKCRPISSLKLPTTYITADPASRHRPACVPVPEPPPMLAARAAAASSSSSTVPPYDATGATQGAMSRNVVGRFGGLGECSRDSASPSRGSPAGTGKGEAPWSWLREAELAHGREADLTHGSARLLPPAEEDGGGAERVGRGGAAAAWEHSAGGRRLRRWSKAPAVVLAERELRRASW